jgi:predicted transposase YdaD
MVKLLDWRERMDELESSHNPFATVVLTHLKVLETKRSAKERRTWKFRLTRALYEEGYGRQEILDLYRFIDWAMILPEAVEREFWQELQTFEEERKVTYVTNAERFGFERGIQEGRQAGRQEGESSLVLRLLKRRLGGLSPETEAQIVALSLTRLEELGEALLDFSKSSDLSDWLQSLRS